MLSRSAGGTDLTNGGATRIAAAAGRAIRRRSCSQWLPFGIGLLIAGYFLFRQEPAPQLFANSDKFGHAGAFFALVVLGNLATSRAIARFLVLLVSIPALAITSEWIQHTALLPLRHGDVGDLVADLCGLAVGLIVIFWCDWRQRWVVTPIAER